MKYSLLHKENIALQSKLDTVLMKLEQVQVEKKSVIEKYGEMKDEKRHDIAIQTDSVRVIYNVAS